jgi:hypothetical protein
MDASCVSSRSRKAGTAADSVESVHCTHAYPTPHLHGIRSDALRTADHTRTDLNGCVDGHFAGVRRSQNAQARGSHQTLSHHTTPHHIRFASQNSTTSHPHSPSHTLLERRKRRHRDGDRIHHVIEVHEHFHFGFVEVRLQRFEQQRLSHHTSGSEGWRGKCKGRGMERTLNTA